MYAWFLKLPRASAKARVLAGLMVLVGAFNAWHALLDLHDDLAVARWMAWFTLGLALTWLPAVLAISLVGRVPNIFVRSIPGALKMSPRELHVAIHADLSREKQRSREL